MNLNEDTDKSEDESNDLFVTNKSTDISKNNKKNNENDENDENNENNENEDNLEYIHVW